MEYLEIEGGETGPVPVGAGRRGIEGEK